jgi:hypothetical protein
MVAALLAAPDGVVAQARGSRVAAQVLIGAAGSVAGTIVLARVGSQIEGTDCNCDDPGLLGALLGGSAGAVLGAAIPVYAVGGREGGSLGGATGGALVGFLGFFMVRGALDLDADGVPFWAAFWGMPTAGAVLGYHFLSGPPSVPVSDRLRVGVTPTRRGSVVSASLRF